VNAQNQGFIDFAGSTIIRAACATTMRPKTVPAVIAKRSHLRYRMTPNRHIASRPLISAAR
jgi:hypothetical protein